MSDIIDPESTQVDRLQSARERFDFWCSDKSKNLDAARAKAKRDGEDPPDEKAWLPNVWSATDLSEVAGFLDEAGVQPFLSDEVFAEAGFGDCIDWALKKLRDHDRFIEIKALAGHRIVVRWERRAGITRDGPHKMIVPGKVAAVSVADRLAWTGDGVAPSFVFTLSIPFFWLADAEDKEWALHSLLMQCAVGDEGKPYKRKPDIAASAATLGRYGFRGWRQAAAIAHVMAGESVENKLREYGFDVITGQGLLWSTAAPARQLDVRDVKPAKPSTKRGWRAARAGA